MGVPVGNNYPKMVTITVGSTLVPAIYPPGDVRQFQIIYLNDAAAEKAYTGNGVTPFSTVSSGGSQSWENRHGGR